MVGRLRSSTRARLRFALVIPLPRRPSRRFVSIRIFLLHHSLRLKCQRPLLYKHQTLHSQPFIFTHTELNSSLLLIRHGINLFYPMIQSSISHFPHLNALWLRTRPDPVVQMRIILEINQRVGKEARSG